MLLFTGSKKSMGNSSKSANKENERQSIFGPPLSVFGLPVDRNIIFSNHKNVYRKKIETRQRKLIVKISFLKFFLQPNENILLLTTGYSPITFWELLLTFPAFILFRRALFVFTTKRLIHIPTSFKHGYRQTISQMRYMDCHKMTVKGRSLVVDLKNGERRIFSGIGAAETKKIKYLIGHLPVESGINPDIEIHALCPSCTNGLPEDSKTCPKCKLPFKDKQKATLRSILIPAGGFFYGRHRFYGAIMALFETIIMTSIAFAGLNLSSNVSQKNLILLVFLAIVLVSVKAINAYHCNLLVQYPLPEKTDFQRLKV